MRKAITIILLLATICYGDTFTSHLKPNADSTLDIGTTSLLWQYVYSDSFTDGTANWTGSSLSGFTSISGTTLTDGVLSINSGSISSAVSGTFSGTLTGGTLTDGVLSISGGSISSAINGTFSGTVTAEQLTSTDDITATDTITGGTLTDGTATLTGGAMTGATYNGLTITASGNTFNLTRGTGSLDIAAGKTVNIDDDLSVGTAATLTVGTGIGYIDFPDSNVSLGFDGDYRLNQSVQTTDAVTFGSVNGLSITAAGNTFNLTQGTGSLDVAAGKTVNIDGDVTIQSDGLAVANFAAAPALWAIGDGTATYVLRSDGDHSIGQDLLTTSDVTFNDLTIDDINLENAEKISNTVDGVMKFGGVGGTYQGYLNIDFDQQYYAISVSAGSVGGGTAILFTTNTIFGDEIPLHFGYSTDASFNWETTGNDNLQLGLDVDDATHSGHFCIMEDTDMGNAARSPTAVTANPTLRIYSSDVAQADDYVDFFHDQANANISWVNGDLLLTGGNVGIGITPTAGLTMGDDKLIAVDVNAGLTASTTQSQGQGALTAQVNEISTVANDGDTVTLPTAVTGIMIEIINNGVNTLQIFPASGDNLGLDVNVAEELEANERVEFVAYDTTNWAKGSSTEIIHAEIHDEDNTDAFVINVKTDFHSYHTNGLAAGDLADWMFDAGGAGTSHAIASIADAGGGDITVTTGDAHNLAVGDIISQTNLADANYVGVFDVLTVPVATTYTVTATYTATGTGTVDQAATLEADAVAAGVYSFTYCISATLVGNNETFDFQLYKEATAVTGSKVRRKYGAANDFGSCTGCGVVSIANGDKISLALSNEDTAANIILRNLTIVLIRL